MTREIAILYVIPALGLAAVVFTVLLLIVLTLKRRRFSPFFVFRAYLLFAVVFFVGAWMMAAPFTMGYGISDVLSGGPAVDSDGSGADDGGDPSGGGDSGESDTGEEPPPPSLPEMSEAEARFLVRDLQSPSQLLRLNAIERLSRSRPREQDRESIRRALEPLTRDSDSKVRTAARNALISLDSEGS